MAGASDDKLQILALYVTDPMSVQAAAAELNRQAIDLLLNNAGVMGARGQTIGNIDYDAWAKVLDANTIGPMRVSEAFVDHVARSERKLIVTLTSGMGSLADNTSGGWIAYRSSKAAVNMVMRSLAIDLAPRGITCVVVNPGWVRTDMGGPQVTLTATDSVKRLRHLIEMLGPNPESNTGNAVLHVLNVNTGEVQKYCSYSTTEHTPNPPRLNWSPDGTHVAFGGNVPGDDKGYLLLALDTSTGIFTSLSDGIYPSFGGANIIAWGLPPQ